VNASAVPKKKTEQTATVGARVSPQFRATVYAAAERKGQTAAGFIVDAIVRHMQDDRTAPATRTDITLAVGHLIRGMIGDPADYESFVDEFCDGWREFRAWQASRRNADVVRLRAVS
jgi:hypothetical protein